MDVAAQSSDVFQQAGIVLPIHLSTRARRWASLLLITFFGAFVVAADNCWNTFQPLLIADHVWQGPGQVHKLVQDGSLSVSFAFIGGAVSGLVYDTFGPRFLGCFACFASSICLCIMALAVRVPSLNYLLWIYPVNVAFSFSNTLSFYAFMWLLPGEESTVAATVGVAGASSNLVGLLAPLLRNALGLQMSGYFIMLAVMCACAGIAAFLIFPPQQEMQSIVSRLFLFQAKLEVGAMGSGPTDAHAQADDAPIESEVSLRDRLSDVWSKLGSGWTLITKVSPAIIAIMYAYSVCCSMLAQFYGVNMYPIQLRLVGTAKADQLATIFSEVSVATGVISVLLTGRVVDAVGVVPVVRIMILPAIAFSVCSSVPNFPALLVGQILYNVMNFYFAVVGMRLVAIYAPPQLFGTMSTYSNLLLASATLVFMPGMRVLVKAIADSIDSHTPALTVLLTTGSIWCCLYIIICAVAIVYWWYRPPPKIGSVTMDDVHEAARGAAAARAEGAEMTQEESAAFQKSVVETAGVQTSGKKDKETKLVHDKPSGKESG